MKPKAYTLLILASLALASCASQYDSAAVVGHATGAVPNQVAGGPMGLYKYYQYQPYGFAGYGGPVAAPKSLNDAEASKAQSFFGR